MRCDGRRRGRRRGRPATEAKRRTAGTAADRKALSKALRCAGSFELSRAGEKPKQTNGLAESRRERGSEGEEKAERESELRSAGAVAGEDMLAAARYGLKP